MWREPDFPHKEEGLVRLGDALLKSVSLIFHPY